VRGGEEKKRFVIHGYSRSRIRGSREFEEVEEETKGEERKNSKRKGSCRREGRRAGEALLVA
jgi:hypothetical protein